MQAFAIIPAAGRSQRMGRPKLLLPWGTGTLIEHVIGIWKASQVQRIVLVAHPHDDQMAQLAANAGAEVVQPVVAPPDMKASVRAALDYLSPSEPELTDAWLLAPADMPGLTAAAINRLVDAYAGSWPQDGRGYRVWVASCQGRPGHPVLFPWSLAPEVSMLGVDEGLDVLVRRHPVERVEVGEDAVSADLDTPQDYERWRATWQR